jgi:hypothetical protein
MSSIIDKLSKRLDAYAAKMETLEAEVKTLRAMTPLEAFTAGLKTATPEQAAEWFAQCQQVAAVFAPASASVKEPKAKKAATNATGPTEWNVFIQATWRSMAAASGVLYEDFEGETKDKDFKEAAKKVGVTYQGVMKEASRRKAEAEGRDPEAPKAKKPKAPKEDTSLAALKAKVAAARAAKTSPAPVPAPQAEEAPAPQAEAEDPLMAQYHKDAQEAGWVQIQHKSVLHYKDPETGELYSFPDLNAVGIFKADGSFEAYF